MVLSIFVVSTFLFSISSFDSVYCIFLNSFFYVQKNWFFYTNSNVHIPTSLQPDVSNLDYLTKQNLLFKISKVYNIWLQNYLWQKAVPLLYVDDPKALAKCYKM